MTIQDSTHSIVKNAKRFFSGTAISRATGLGREVVMAIAFGTQPLIAAFWMAFRFAHLLRRLFGEGALNAAFIPHFETLRKENGFLGARFFYDLSTGISLFLLLITLLAEAILGAFLLFMPMSQGNYDVVKLTMLMLPALVFICLYALNSALLNCEKNYFLPSVAPALLNIIWIGAILILWKLPLAKAIDYLAMTVVLAFVLQWIVTVPPVFRYLRLELGDKWRSHSFSGREILKILRPFLLGLVGVAATQINTALDTLFARAANEQGPAYLWYAIRIQQLPLGLLGVGLTGALLPPISRAVERGDREQSLHFLNFALSRTLLFMIPLTAAIFVLGFSGINLVYGHGEFSQEATFQTTLCLWGYGLALAPMTLVLVSASACYAHKNYRTPTLFSAITVGLNIALNALFVYGFHLGAVSIALATTLGACVNGALLLSLLKKNYGLKWERLFSSTIKVSIASLIAIAATAAVGSLYHDQTLAWLLGHDWSPFSRSLITQLTTFGMMALSFTLSFLLSAQLLRIELFSWSRLRFARRA